MKPELTQTLWYVHCNRDMIFKKVQISELVRLDVNIDILPEEKGYSYTDENGKESTECFYIDMSSTEFIVYNEDLKKCGYYNYNDEYLCVYGLPLNKKVNLCKESCEIIKPKCVRINAKSQLKQNYDEDDEAFKRAITESLKHDNVEDKSEEDESEEDESDEYYDEDKALKIAIAESLKDGKNKSVSRDNPQKLCGIKAQERIDAYKNKYKPKQKYKPNGFHF